MSLMMMRAALIARNALPPQYQRVEYLRSTGSQKIITPISSLYSTNKDVIQFKIRYTDRSRRQLNGYPDGFYIGENWSIWENSGMISTTGPNVMEWYRVSATSEYNDTGVRKITAEYNDTQLINIRSNGNPGHNLCFFDLYNGGYSNIADISYAKYYRDGELILNLIPCRRKSDNKPGMWDTVSKTFFTNSGTGEDFTLGPDVL